MSWRALAFVVTGLAVLAGTFLFLRPEPPPSGGPAAPAAVPAAPRVVELRASAVALQVVRAHQGEVVVLRVTSESADELHVHGYDLRLALQAGVPGELRFVADRAGRFEIELHRAHAEIGVLEVQPR